MMFYTMLFHYFLFFDQLLHLYLMYIPYHFYFQYIDLLIYEVSDSVNDSVKLERACAR